ncbi:MAG: class I SAM-dependent methyltransferase [Casimicrobiaceae bacterium]
MTPSHSDSAFAGSIPQIYEQYLVPLIFETYAADLARRVAHRHPGRVLELAAGTGVVTRHLATTLAPDVAIVATDINEPMLDEAARRGTSRPVEWRAADALQLPFADESFDVVVCQFGVMFFPDRCKGYAEARRVLRSGGASGGAFIYNVWDRIEDNEFAAVVTEALQAMFPHDPPRFMARTPHGYHDESVIRAELTAAGFTGKPAITTRLAVSRADSPRIPAVAYCQGTPLRNEIEARDRARLGEATDIATAAIERRFGKGIVEGRIQAKVVEIERA